MRYSVIIATRNGGKVIGGCLSALERQTIRDSEYEIIVVDDASTDHTAELVEEFCRRSPNLHLIRLEERRGPAHARNEGVRRANGEIIFFTDDDAIPPPDWMERISSLYEPGVAGVGGLCEPIDNSIYARYELASSLIRYGRNYEKLDGAGTLNASLRREVLEEIGGFDTRFTEAGAEDADLNLRLCHRGYRLVVEPSIVVKHRFPAGMSQFVRRWFKRGRWGAVFEKKHALSRGVWSLTVLLWSMLALWAHLKFAFKIASLSPPQNDEIHFFVVCWAERVAYNLGYIIGQLK